MMYHLIYLIQPVKSHVADISSVSCDREENRWLPKGHFSDA